jgi:nuclear transport factor 2 (NTF2) superfamily protein
VPLKRLLVSACLCVAVSACTEPEERYLPEDVDAFARGYTAAWNSHDPEGVAAFYAANGALTVNGGEPAVGREAVAAVAQSFMDAFPDLLLINLSNEDVDGRIRYHWRFVGTHSGPDGTGAAVDFSGFEAWIFDEQGLILDSQGSFDAQDYERQLAAGSRPTL